MVSEGTAFLDPAGRVLAADEAFGALVGAGPGADLRSAAAFRNGVRERLEDFLAGRGPAVLSVPGAGDSPGLELERLAHGHGVLLRARPSGGDAVPSREYALQAVSLARLAGSVAHEVKNPLNAMVLQLALLSDKIAAASDPLSAACAGNLTSLKNQIARVNEVIRRYLDVADPPQATGFDAGAMVADAASLFGHEARRRRLALTCEAAPGVLRAAGDPARAARLLLGLFWRAVTSTPAEGRLLARAAASGDEVVLSIEHAAGRGEPDLAWMDGIVSDGAAAMGGRLEAAADAGIVRVALVLPKERSS
ncbi:MAG TPA: histidine kinase dimerization/phospho-acceptor domain-containing protein [Anaeromyxobacteraceae bacterium]|nr:histidine kinase dimerization/phospho-acceptor domain-containing protein [Anaeromyxobacteraceae bacterium]